MLAFSGLELALVCRNQNTRRDFLLMIITAGTCLALNSAGGLLAGWVLAGLIRWGFVRLDTPPIKPS